MQVTISQINSAIAETLGEATGIVRIQDAAQSDEGGLAEGMPDVPALQVYWQSLSTDAENGATDRRTFGAGVRQTQLIFNVDVYVRQRSMLSEDVAKVLEIAEAIVQVLETQNRTSFFGLEGIRATHWSAERVSFDYASANYAGIRFVLTLTVF